ncbi:MAG: sensor histidine kinase [Adhaeribacter sp.]
MRYLFLIVLWCVWLPALSEQVLTITNTRKPIRIAPYGYVLEDFGGKLTYAQVLQMPKNAFGLLSKQGVKGLLNPPKAIWLRLELKNKTSSELFLLSKQRSYQRLDVYVQDETGKLTIQQVGSAHPMRNRLAPLANPLISLGHHPQIIHVAMFPNDVYRDYMEIVDIGEAIRNQKHTGFWQGIVLGIYLLLLVYAIIFGIRLRLPILGWYALFLFTNTHWFLHRSGYFEEFWGNSSLYTQFIKYYPLRLMVVSCWAIFHIKFLHLKQYSKFLYYLLVGWLGLELINHLCLVISQYFGTAFAPLDMPLSWLGLDWAAKIIIALLLMLISVIYVCLKNFKEVRLYALGLGIGVTAMLLSIVTLYNISWLPFYPYNYTFVFGSVVEIIIFAYAVAEQHWRRQTQTQRELIAQLKENVHQRDKLLRIRDEIARDLHDEVGATLTSISISTKLVQKKVGLQQTDIEPILAQINADSEETIHSIRDTIWALNSDNDSPAKFQERLRTVARQMLANQNITLSFDSDVALEALPPFSMELRRNLYLVYKEALHNIVKHAQASKVSIQIRQSAGRLQINISDNGSGFDTTSPTEGNGLLNFQKRAHDGGFKVGVQSKAGTGTTIFLQVPIQEAAAITINQPVSL